MSDNPAIDPAMEILLDAAVEAAARSYSPYSGFKVGAALRLDDGSIVSGTNVENVSYGLTICAERAALVRAVAERGPAIRFRAVAVANLNHAASSPCGACRQMLAEFAAPDALAVFLLDGGPHAMRFADLLPLAFNTNTKEGQ